MCARSRGAGITRIAAGIMTRPTASSSRWTLRRMRSQSAARLQHAGLFPHRLVGSHERIRPKDVLAYKRRQERRHAAIDELAVEAQAMGTYD